MIEVLLQAGQVIPLTWIEVFDKFLERLLRPETLIGLATLVTAIKAWQQGKDNQKEIAKNTLLTAAAKQESTKIAELVNGMSARGLGREAGQADRIASLTGEPSDERAAVRAHEEYEAKKAIDAKVSQTEGPKG